jgi:adenine-specific DNA-methyltransferase
MEKKEIREILNQKYNRENWKFLTKNIFDNVEYFKTPISIKTNNEKILDFVQIGNLKLKDEKKVALFELKLIKNLNIYKNKVELRNIVTRFIDQYSNHGVLVVFDNQGSDYRLTFSSKFSEIDEQGNIKEIETSPKRYSYLLGENESCLTPAERLHLLSQSRGNLKIDDIVEAFSVEKVTKEFFEKYRELYLDLAENIAEIKKTNPLINKDFIENNLNEFDFSKKLLGQIIFIYFLQKKGLLGIKENNDGTFNKWGDGPRDFLRQLFEQKYIKYKNFYDEVLEPLFFEALSVERNNDYFSLFKCKIPFLNGGLFEKFYNWSGTHLIIDNEIVEQIINTFDQYNFTIQEEDPLDKEVAIDPEMLGKIFESLLDVTERKKEGIFYTPREIVEFKCAESLKYYLSDELEKSKLKLNPDQLDRVLDRTVDELNSTNEKKQFELIYNKLLNLKICDPAIGSGAYPLGLLTILVSSLKKIRRILGKTKISDYRLKKNIIQNCIYGVDKNFSSVEIAKLRLWLSLIIEEDSLDYIEPLPNLEYKIVNGNSLIGVEHDLLNDHLVIEFVKLKEEFYQENNFKKKENLKDKIDKIRKELNVFDKFDFEINFHEIFAPNINKQKKSGFDIIIANPPYLGEKNNKEIFREIKSGKLKEFYEGKMDLFYFFFHQGINLLNNGGILCFITTNYFVTAQGAKKLRKDFHKRCEMKRFINFKEFKIFESAQGQHNMITILKKNDDIGKNKIDITNCNLDGLANDFILKTIFKKENEDCEYLETTKQNLFDSEEHYIRLSAHDGVKSSSGSILNKISKNNFPLKIYCNIKQGIVSGADKVTKKHLNKYKIKAKQSEGIFVLSENELKKEKFTSAEKKIIKPFYKNSDIKKFQINKNKDNFVIYIDKNTNIKKYPNIYKHLTKFKKILENKRETIENKIPWYSLHWPRDKNLLENRKIVCPRRAKLNNFAFDNGKNFEQSDIMIIAIKQKYEQTLSFDYLLGLLNSKLFYFWLTHRGKVKGRMLELYGRPLEEVPIKVTAINYQKKVSKVVKDLKYKYDLNKFNNLNKYIYEIFDLSKDEIKIVENLYPKNII